MVLAETSESNFYIKAPKRGHNLEKMLRKYTYQFKRLYEVSQAVSTVSHG